MGRFGNILRIGTLAGLITLMPSCEKEKPYELPNFKFISEKTIRNNLDLPTGLSSGNHLKKAGSKNTKGTAAEVSGVFIEAPIFLNFHSNGGIQLSQNPKISEYSGTLGSLSTSSLGEIDLTNYQSDFDSPAYYAMADSLWKAHGLTLDALVLSDGTMLSSSNSSDKIFKRNSFGEIEIFLQNKDLERITDMVEGSDGKIYAVQAPLFDDNSNLIYPKRVISIENGIIKTEFELPSAINPNFSMNLEDIVPYWWKDGSLLYKLKIIENSVEGKKRFGTEFYVSDQLENVIYKVDSEKRVSVLAKDISFPSSLAVDSIGNVFYTTTPLFRGITFSHKVSLDVLNPETSEHTSLHKFDESIKDYSVYGGKAYFTYTSLQYSTSVGHNVTNVLYESKDKLEFLITNSLQGTLKYVTLEK